MRGSPLKALLAALSRDRGFEPRRNYRSPDHSFMAKTQVRVLPGASPVRRTGWESNPRSEPRRRDSNLGHGSTKHCLQEADLGGSSMASYRAVSLRQNDRPIACPPGKHVREGSSTVLQMARNTAGREPRHGLKLPPRYAAETRTQPGRDTWRDNIRSLRGHAPYLRNSRRAPQRRTADA